MLRSRNDYLGEILYLIATTPAASRDRLFKIYYNIQHKSVYTKELMELEKIRKEREKEQEMLWDE